MTGIMTMMSVNEFSSSLFREEARDEGNPISSSFSSSGFRWIWLPTRFFFYILKMYRIETKLGMSFVYVIRVYNLRHMSFASSFTFIHKFNADNILPCRSYNFFISLLSRSWVTVWFAFLICLFQAKCHHLNSSWILEPKHVDDMFVCQITLLFSGSKA